MLWVWVYLGGGVGRENNTFLCFFFSPDEWIWQLMKCQSPGNPCLYSLKSNHTWLVLPLELWTICFPLVLLDIALRNIILFHSSVPPKQTKKPAESIHTHTHTHIHTHTHTHTHTCARIPDGESHRHQGCGQFRKQRELIQCGRNTRSRDGELKMKS